MVRELRRSLFFFCRGAGGRGRMVRALYSGWSSRVRVLVREVVLIMSYNFTSITVPLSIQVYIWVPANLMVGVTL